ncbi:MAG: flagellar hook-basal body complex protein FliE [Roseburia sp.]|nr:flagellar hook-basal body complex protein FliE [Roseburia sp.]
MDFTSISALSAVNGLNAVDGLNAAKSLSGIDGTASLTGMLTEKENKAEGSMFEAFLNSAIDNIKTTNSYLSDAEDEKIRFALGETENAHDLSIALQKASATLQYTVAVRDKLLEAYRELMQMQI